MEHSLGRQTFLCLPWDDSTLPKPLQKDIGRAPNRYEVILIRCLRYSFTKLFTFHITVISPCAMRLTYLIYDLSVTAGLSSDPPISIHRSRRQFFLRDV